MLVRRKCVDEWGNELPEARVSGDVPNPEKGVLDARFSLTRLPVLSDNDLNKAAQRRQNRKGRDKMASPETVVDNDDVSEDAGRRGAPAKYKLEVESVGVTVKDVELSKEVYAKDEKGETIVDEKGEKKVQKIYTQASKELSVSDLNGALALFSGDESSLWSFLSEAATAYFQRTDRQRLNAKAQGPEKNMKRAIAALVAAGIDESAARAVVENKLREEGIL